MIRRFIYSISVILDTRRLIYSISLILGTVSHEFSRLETPEQVQIVYNEKICVTVLKF